MNNKIGLGIVTCGREEMFKQCVNSIPACVDTLVVVNDATPYDKSSYPSNVKEVIQNSKHKPVGSSKNALLRYLIQDDVDHLFIMEDDVYVKDPTVFEKYIKTAETTGIWHMNMGYHGPANFKNGIPAPRQIVDYGNGIELALNLHVVGAFSYYLRGIIKNIGYMDDRFINAWDHCQHTARIARDGLHPPFWWFADVAGSYNLIGDLDPTLINSQIRKDNPEWMKNIKEGAELFKHTMGFYPTQMPDVGQDIVIKRLEEIQKNYARKST